MDAIQAVFEELNYPSAARLQKALKARGIPYDAEQVRTLVAAEPTRQVQAPGPVYNGKISSKGQNELWFADLIDFTQAPSISGERYILCVQDVFTRYLYVRALVDKTV